ncbi:hypothetical protein [Erwinia sp.]|uniref:hypothetical protein n=1 Tax=Erwinia citreus TaxID=558 RepID=UPI0028A1D170|nr:hypothetical protein [Erwinia sp.]
MRPDLTGLFSRQIAGDRGQRLASFFEKKGNKGEGFQPADKNGRLLDKDIRFTGTLRFPGAVEEKGVARCGSGAG